MIAKYIRQQLARRYWAVDYRDAHPLAARNEFGQPKDLAPTATELIGDIQRDPLGPVRHSPDCKAFERLLPESSWAHAQLLHNSPTVRRLVAEGRINSFSIRNQYFDPNYSAVVRVLESPRVPTVINPCEIPLELSLQMAETWIHINMVLLHEGLGLLDAHDENFGFGNLLHPVWLDHGSIVSVQHPLTGIFQFLETRLFPLSVAVRKPELSKEIRGQKINFIAFWETHPVVGGLFALGAVFLLAKRMVRATKQINGWRQTDNPRTRFWFRRLVLILLKFIISSLRRRVSPSGFWSDYGPSRSKHGMPSLSGRDNVIVSLAASLDWSSCCDIGANDGMHVVALAKNVAEPRTFTAIDADDFAIGKFVQKISVSGFPHSFTAKVQSFFSVYDKSDLVLALAITHHLSLQQHRSFDSIAKHLALMSRKHCIVEFMPMGLATDAQVVLATHRRTPEWYTEKNFVAALQRHFSQVSDVGRSYFASTGIVHRIAFLAQHS
jgi:hypothetical protein